MTRPPSQAVIEAVEQVTATHTTRLPADWKGSYDDWMHAHVVEVARAAEIAALKAVADECEANARDWYGIFRDVDDDDLAAVRSAMQAKGKDIDDLSAWYFREVLTTRADILRRWADELTNDEQSQSCASALTTPQPSPA